MTLNSIMNNISSVLTQNNVSQTQNTTNNLLEELSSGNTLSSNDPAEVAINNLFMEQLNGLDQASSNASQGVSAVQTANGGLDQIADSLQQLNNLSIESSNSTLSPSQHDALNTQAQQLVAQIDTVATQTQYNGQNLLSTSGGLTSNLQVGGDVGNHMSVNFPNSRTDAMGIASNYSAVAGATPSSFADTIRSEFTTAPDSSVNGTTIAPTGANQNSINKINAINDVSSQTGVSAMSFGNAVVGTAPAADDGSSVALNAGDIMVNGVSIGAVGAGTANGLVNAINAVSGQTGVTADAGSSGDDNLVLSNTTDAAINVSINSANAATRSGLAQGNITVAAGANGAIVLNQNVNSSSVNFGDTQTGQALTGNASTSATLTSNSISQINLSTVSDSQMATLAIGQALNMISNSQASLGAYLNSIDSTESNLSTSSLNVQQASGQNSDTDFASAVSSLSQNQTQQQAGIWAMAQANAQSGMLLALLGGSSLS